MKENITGTCRLSLDRQRGPEVNFTCWAFNCHEYSVVNPQLRQLCYKTVPSIIKVQKKQW